MIRFLLLLVVSNVLVVAASKPNIVLIYADDLGYGDVSCYGATRVKTPNIDRLAREGLRFTDGHSTSGTCTPSRYSMLTGEYAFRKRGTGVLPGDAALIIEPGRQTLASILQSAGYTTGVVGKWHLGIGPGPGVTDWNGEIKPGPLEIGFDYSFLMPATGDRVPCVYVENHRVVGLDPADPIKVSFAEPLTDEPTGKARPDLLKTKPSHGHDQTIINGVSRIGYMSGGKSARWRDEDMADEFVKKAIAFIELPRKKDAPFFLFFSTHDIHVPRLPHERFVGKTQMGPRGDAILSLDWSVGEILKTLDRHQLADNTMVIFSSDNGPVVDDGYRDDAAEKLGDHKPAGPLRGGKYSKFEAGTRVPFIIRWPARIKPGVSSALVSQIDFSASFAALTGAKFKTATAPDSRDTLQAFLGNSQKGRDHLIEHANGLAVRQGPWKYIEATQGQARSANTNTETGNAPQSQLYNLDSDIGETRNLAAENANKLRELQAILELERAKGMPNRPGLQERR